MQMNVFGGLALTPTPRPLGEGGPQSLPRTGYGGRVRARADGPEGTIDTIGSTRPERGGEGSAPVVSCLRGAMGMAYYQTLFFSNKRFQKI